MNIRLGLSKNTVNRWFNNDPKKFYTHITKISEETDTTTKDLIKMVEQRIEDLKLLKA